MSKKNKGRKCVSQGTEAARTEKMIESMKAWFLKYGTPLFSNNGIFSKRNHEQNSGRGQSQKTVR